MSIASHTTLRRSSFAAIAIVAAVGLTGCSAISSLFGNASRDETGQVTEAGDVSAFDFQVGDCLIAADTQDIESQKAVPCSEPHDEEVYVVFDLVSEDGTYPSEDVIDEQVYNECALGFEKFIGVAYEASTEWDITYVTPTQQTWDKMDDRMVSCSIVSVSGEQWTGSAKDTAK